MSQPTQNMHDVAIVGWGPTGAIAAALLGQLGLSTIVIERTHEVYDKPRAIALDHEILRVFQQLGLEQQIAEFTEPFTDSHFFGVDGDLIKCMSTVAPPYPLGYTPSVVFSQPPVEKLLRQHVAGLPSVTVALGQTVTGLTQTADHVSLALQGEDGKASDVRARYVIACDGASSTVRDLVDLELDDLGFDEPWLVVDVLLNDSGMTKAPCYSAQYCEPARPCSYIMGPGRHRRWEISINPGEDPRQLATPEGTWPLLARWITPEDGTLWRQASYRFHALVVHQWRAERVFLAGDAAHQQPPFLGQGMCQGVRDAVNLCWKLHAVLRQQAPDALLNTYGVERGAHVKALTQRIKHIGQLIGQRDVDAARARDRQLLQDAGGQVQPTPRQDVQPPISGGQGIACLDTAQSTATAPAVGTLFPQPWLAQGSQRKRLDHRAGCGWRLVLAAQASAPLRQAAQTNSQYSSQADLTLVDLAHTDWQEADGVVANWMTRHGVRAALLRPDHYVFGVINTPEELSAQLAQRQALLKA